jgi:GNAT superfamily N-acetyltransferase
MTVSTACPFCGATVDGVDDDAFTDAFLVHVRADHSEVPYPDQAVRNYAAATQRVTGPVARVDVIGAVSVQPVTEDNLDEWIRFFDRDAFAGRPEWAACYCLEPHRYDRNLRPEQQPMRSWADNRAAMIERLRAGAAFGYLAGVDGRPAGWVNASPRAAYGMFAEGEGAQPADDDVIGIACYVVAPPYRGHGLAAALLERVIADAPARGAACIEAYPLNAPPDDATRDFRGSRALYDRYGFEPVADRGFDTVVRRPV